ncbi:MAG: succinylglutamate desuccinylase/aspartoacylase family protein [Gammaproteobacteria bacterium]|nr:succinylglutamate desuccinylase/aspartoacylase family protein [Gammaproteobacteria bacterium]NIR85722.1 succinylglutamate desuccinylase/aspartoacylase family protein [Gammaproteobacteria bacterium]NIR90255.1 succinylglutamate desuccinylase/aspartoacylase family protein [Gammaproteobacteria bacterium]NIU06856.1 succinylglutamate desuccinylase/aspartoacylase family protein [Gammaproteobacteria bacterium]NIV53789.1 succinylglutamate desuccinylase [Gammaproteobacteria bacterium]
MSEELVIGGKSIRPRSRITVELPVPQLYTHTPMTMPVHVVRGRADGPRLFVCAAIHGDELNGVEIIRRLLKRPTLKRLRGTLLAVPIVNVFGVIHNSRYLPDRRDLNRAFPGSERGSLAARLAHLFMREIVGRCTHGIDLHTGAIHRANLPQVRARLDDEPTAALARAFGVPVLLNSDLRDGSLREAAAERGIPMLLYEAGEALRFDEFSIRVGVQGVLSVMRALEMLPPRRRGKQRVREPFVARSSSWIRAPQSGILRAVTPLGARVKKGEILGVVSDPFGESESEVQAHASGVVIGRVQMPLVHAGEALFHVARFESARQVVSEVEALQTHHEEAIAAAPEPPLV